MEIIYMEYASAIQKLFKAKRSTYEPYSRTLHKKPLICHSRACFKINSSLHIFAENFSTTFLTRKFVILSLKKSDDLFFSQRLFSGFISAFNYYNIIQITPISYCFYTLYPLYTHTYILISRSVSKPYLLLS